MPITLIVAASSVEIQLRFLPIETPFDPLPNFAIDSINTPLLTTSMLSATIVSIHVVVIPTLSD